MEKRKGLSLNSKKNKLNDKSEMSSGIITPVTKKSSSLYKDVLKESAGKSVFNSRNTDKKNDEFDFHCSFDSDEENMSDVSLPISQSDKDRPVLQGVVAYVEVRTNTENRFEGISKQMELLGAVVVKKFIPEVTHVVFKDGKKSTRDKAIKKGVHLVNVLWVDSCKQSGKHVSEDLFPVTLDEEMHTPLIPGKARRTKSMQPRSFEEDLRNSAERVNRRRRRLEADGKMSPLTTKVLSYQESPVNPTSLASPCLFPSETPQSHDHLSEKPEFLGSLESKQDNNSKSTWSGVGMETPTSPAATPLDSLQTDSGLRKKRKRRLSSAISDETTKEKKTKKRKTNRINNDLKEDTSSKNDKFKTEQKKSFISEEVDPFAFTDEDNSMNAQPESDCKLKQSSSKGTSNASTGKGVARNSASNDVFNLTDNSDVKSLPRCKTKKTSLKGSKIEEKADSILNELDIFTFNEEEGPEVKTSRLKKKSRSKSQKDIEDKQLDSPSKLSLHRKEHPKDEVDLLKGEKANRTLSDSGISLGEVEVTIPNKQRPKKFEKPTHTAASSKVDTKSDKLRLDTEESNLENHSVSSGSETKRFEEPHNKITAKGVKKSGNGKGKKDKTTSINEIDKVEDLDEEVSPAKKTKRPKIVSVKQNSNLSKNKQEERPLITCSEAEGKKYNINKAYDGKKAQKVNQRKVSDVSENEEEDEEASTCTPSSSDNEDTDNEDDVNEEQSNAKNKLETNKTKNQPRKKVIRTRKPSRSLVLTSMHFCDQDVVLSVVRKLGGFYVADKVSQDTTHVISGTPKRTLNVLTAIAQGCWLVSPEWVMKSLEAGYWIDEEPYELSDSFPSAQLSRLERANIGPDYQQELFLDVEPIYVCENTSPPTDALIKLITLCGGQVCTSIRKAGVCIGNINRKVHAIKVSESWIIDSITEHIALPFESYAL